MISLHCLFLYTFLEQVGHSSGGTREIEKRRGREGWGEASNANPSGMALVQTLHCLSVNLGEAAGGAETHISSHPFTCQSYLTNMVTYSLFQPPLWITFVLKWAKCALHLKHTETHPHTHTHTQHTHSGLFSVPLLCPSPSKLEGIHMNQKCWSFTKALGRGKGHPPQAGKMHAILAFPLIP